MKAGGRRGRGRLRLWLLGVIGLLFIFSVPWYRSESDELRLILGLPDWVAVALGCYALAACLNSIAWLSTDIDDEASVAGPETGNRAGEKGP